jgi:transglutaminase-like putative cysteine protease
VHLTLSSSLTADVLCPATLDLQVAVAGDRQRSEELLITCDGLPLEPVELAAPHGGRLHVLQAPAGRLEVSYRCELAGDAAPAAPAPLDRAVYLRPSRYAESDRLAALAAAELGSVTDPLELLGAVRTWVHGRLSYVPGSSRGTDGAVDTLLAGAGVCRDHAHLAVALLRALDVPAELVSVYAPGLSPMDFHAVVEALVDDAWWVVDATGWRRAARWCASRPGATPRTRPSCPPTAVSSRSTACRSRRRGRGPAAGGRDEQVQLA